MTSQSRRQFVRTAAGVSVGITASAAVAGCASAADPEDPSRKPTFVLVHGSASNAMFWTPLVRALALRGHRCLPVDLPGHGFAADLPAEYQAPQDLERFAQSPSPVADATLADYAAHVIDVVRRVRRHGPVILVGHSLGGSTLGKVGNALSDELARLVYVSAFCCVEEQSPLELLATPEAREGAPTATATPALAQAPDGVTRYNWRTADHAALDGYHAMAAGDLSEAQLRTVVNYAQQPDEAIEPSLADARVQPGTWGRIPRTYVRLTEDKIVTPALARKMITAADRLTPDNTFDVRDIATTHMGVVFTADELAGILEEAAAA